MLKKPTLTLFLFVNICAYAQDTLNISLSQADSMFLSNNYLLLAAGMNIESHKAHVIQARLYPNPVAAASFNLLDPENRKVLHLGNTGQASFQVEQLFLLGGKRKSEIAMARTNAEIAGLEFEQLLKELKYQLHIHLYAAGQTRFLLEQYNSQLELLDALLQAYEAGAAMGNIPLKDIVRLKGAYISLNNERAEILKNYYEAQNNLQVLLQTQSVIRFEFSDQDVERYIQAKTPGELLALATEHRSDLLILRQNQALAQQYLRYQKQLKIPDVSLFLAYDQNSGVFRHEVNAGLAIPLPLWNKNQGNISAAQIKIAETDYYLKAAQTEISAGILNAHAYYMQSLAEYQKAKSLYNQDFEITIKGMTDNFQKRNISIIEFIDFFEAYNDVIKEISRNNIQLITAAEQLNLLTGKEVY